MHKVEISIERSLCENCYDWGFRVTRLKQSKKHKVYEYLLLMIASGSWQPLLWAFVRSKRWPNKSVIKCNNGRYMLNKRGDKITEQSARRTVSPSLARLALSRPTPQDSMVFSAPIRLYKTEVDVYTPTAMSIIIANWRLLHSKRLVQGC